jgi:predicted nucleotide-binding protein (sugar kinase/HSP70/actin superfamily)
MITRERKMMLGIQPAVVVTAKSIEGAQFDHRNISSSGGGCRYGIALLKTLLERFGFPDQSDKI